MSVGLRMQSASVFCFFAGRGVGVLLLVLKPLPCQAIDPVLLAAPSSCYPATASPSSAPACPQLL
eukprot:1119809-Pelagomonas_calceolata.AAC.4